MFHCKLVIIFFIRYLKNITKRRRKPGHGLLQGAMRFTIYEYMTGEAADITTIISDKRLKVGPRAVAMSVFWPLKFFLVEHLN